MIDAAVLIPIYRDAGGELHIVMILRNAGGVHGGQIGFPGGKRDACDRTMLDTALREAREEIGLDAGRIRILAELPVTETRTTGYRVHPFLARILHPAHWQLAEREIAEVIDVKLSELTRPDARDNTLEPFPSWQKVETAPFYRVGSYRLWGLSFRIFEPVVPRLLAGEWDV
jgi:8-oxo-dGTP pyrophosphatase MutT (NUDIX family)